MPNQLGDQFGLGFDQFGLGFISALQHIQMSLEFCYVFAQGGNVINRGGTS